MLIHVYGIILSTLVPIIRCYKTGISHGGFRWPLLDYTGIGIAAIHDPRWSPMWKWSWNRQEFSAIHFVIYSPNLVGGWATPLKNMNVNWDDDIPNWMGKCQKWQPNHQPEMVVPFNSKLYKTQHFQTSWGPQLTPPKKDVLSTNRQPRNSGKMELYAMFSYTSREQINLSWKPVKSNMDKQKARNRRLLYSVCPLFDLFYDLYAWFEKIFPDQ